ncbi:MAG: hypothetical protein HYZ28_13550 [Myxococcales bacterium]|nr:hypothetical protein [Myxococcales bacterium]
MDPDLLKQMGWSEELIAAAKRVATELPEQATSPAREAEVQFDFGGTVTSNELDLSGSPPVGGTELHVDRG